MAIGIRDINKVIAICHRSLFCGYSPPCRVLTISSAVSAIRLRIPFYVLYTALLVQV